MRIHCFHDNRLCSKKNSSFKSRILFPTLITENFKWFRWTVLEIFCRNRFYYFMFPWQPPLFSKPNFGKNVFFSLCPIICFKIVHKVYLYKAFSRIWFSGYIATLRWWSTLEYSDFLKRIKKCLFYGNRFFNHYTDHIQFQRLV